MDDWLTLGLIELFALGLTALGLTFVPVAITTGVFCTVAIIAHVIAWGGFIFIDGDFDWDFFD